MAEKCCSCSSGRNGIFPCSGISSASECKRSVCLHCLLPAADSALLDSDPDQFTNLLQNSPLCFICPFCMDGRQLVEQCLSPINESIAQLQNSVAAQGIQLTELTSAGEQTRASFATVLKRGISTAPPKITAETVFQQRRAEAELKRRDERASNVILLGLDHHGLCNTIDANTENDDRALVVNVCSQLFADFSDDDITSTKRLQSRNGQTSLLVTLRNRDLRDELLRRAPNLSGSVYDKVFIRKDLTIEQQQRAYEERQRRLQRRNQRGDQNQPRTPAATVAPPAPSAGQGRKPSAPQLPVGMAQPSKAKQGAGPNVQTRSRSQKEAGSADGQSTQAAVQPFAAGSSSAAARGSAASEGYSIVSYRKPAASQRPHGTAKRSDRQQ